MSRPWYRRLIIVAIISSVVTFVLAVGGAGAWYYRKSSRLQTLLDGGRAAEEARDWAAVEANLRSYVAQGGDEPTVFFRIGRAIESGAINDRDRLRAIPFYARSLAKQPNHLETRLRFAELQVMDNPPEAIKGADRILQSRPDQPDAWRIKALARLRIVARTEAAADRLAETDEVVDKALRLAPGDLKLASQAADFYARNAAAIAKARRVTVEEVHSLALRALDAAVEKADDEAEARLARMLFRRRHASVAPGDPVTGEDIRRLVELRPNSNTVRLLAAGWATGRAVLAKTGEAADDGADSARSGSPSRSPGAKSGFRAATASRAPTTGRRAKDASDSSAAIDPAAVLASLGPDEIVDSPLVEEARQHLQAAIENRGDDPLPYWSLAQLQWWCGERDEAVATLTRASEVAGNDRPILLLRTAELELAVGRWAEAKAALDKLDRTLADDMARSAEAADSRSLLTPTADLLRVQWWLGAENPSSDPQEAMRLLTPYLEEGQPLGTRALATYLRGLALAMLDRWDEALESFQRASRVSDVAILPRLAIARCLQQAGRYRDAASQYRLALKQLQARPQESLNVTQIWIELARCSIAEQAQRPVWKREWRSYDEAATQVRQRLPDSPLALFMDLQVARLAADARKIRESEDRIADAKSKFREVPGFWEELAGVRLESGEFDQALEAIERWEKLAGATAHRFRGDLAAAAGDAATAQKHWEAAADSLPTHRQRELLSRRVEAAVRAGDVPTAARLLDAWRAKHPSDRQTAYQSAQLAWNAGDAELLEKAAAELQRVDGEHSRASLFAQTQVAFLRAAQRIAVEPESAECVAARQRLEQAVAALVARRSDDRQARSLQALAAELLGQPREAIKAWRQTIALGEQSPDLKLRLAKLLHEQGQSREALEICFSAPVSPTDSRVGALVAQIMFSTALDTVETETAEQLFRKLMEGPPRRDLPLLLMNVAQLREYQGKPDESIRLTRQALELQPEAVELMNNLAWYLAAYGGDVQEAKGLIERAIEQVGELPQLLDTRGVVLLAAGDAEQAIATLETCARPADAPATWKLHLVEAYRKGGRNVEARALLEEAERSGLKPLSPRDRRAYLKVKVPS